GLGAESVMVVPGAIVQPRHEAVLLAGANELADDVGLVAASLHVVIGVLAGPEAVAGDVFGSQHGVLHAGVARDLDPLVDVEILRGVSGGGIVARRKFLDD